PSANNGDFVNNALDNLSGSSALIGLRSRGLSSRPFVRVQNIQKAAEVKFRDREQALNKELEDIQKKLKSLQTKEQGAGATILTPKQAAAITKFRGQILKLRRDLRQVRVALREDIDRLDAWTKIINIGGMPVLVALLAIILAMVRRGRTRRRIIAAHQ
ncbi:MAG: ABC transporter, partial [Rhodospirillales bacterium]|nr:ABC transporter [Rhodospirillales bacterium]